MGKFKIGEKVRVKFFLSYEDGVPGASVVGPMIKKRGETGTVIDRDIIEKVYAVNFDDNSRWWFGENSLLKVPAQPENEFYTKKNNYKVGDKIKIWDKKDVDLTVHMGYVENMIPFSGQKAVITKVCNSSYKPYYNIDLDNGQWSWSQEMFDGLVSNEKEMKTVTITGTTKEEMQKAADEAITKTFARVWTEEDNERAKRECLKIMEDHIEKTYGNEHIVFSGHRDSGETRAAVIYTGGLYPRHEGGKFLSSDERYGMAKCAPGENNMPWIGRLVAVARAADVRVPKWVYS